MAKTVKATTRKSLDEMSEAHRQHIEKWEPHLDKLGAQFVWIGVMRIPGRNVQGPCYVAIKRGPKNYAIVDYDTEKMPKVTARRVCVDGFETSSQMMEAFKEYRKLARADRASAKAAKDSKTASKSKAKPKRTAKPAAKKKTTAKKTAAKKPAAKRTRKPAAAKK